MVCFRLVEGLLTVLWFPIRCCPEVRTLGELYFDLGSLSVRLKMFLLSLIVFNSYSWLGSSEFTAVELFMSSGKNFLIRDSIIGSDNIWSQVGL